VPLRNRTGVSADRSVGGVRRASAASGPRRRELARARGRPIGTGTRDTPGSSPHPPLSAGFWAEPARGINGLVRYGMVARRRRSTAARQADRGRSSRNAFGLLLWAGRARGAVERQPPAVGASPRSKRRAEESSRSAGPEWWKTRADWPPGGRSGSAGPWRRPASRRSIDRGRDPGAALVGSGRPTA